MRKQMPMFTVKDDFEPLPTADELRLLAYSYDILRRPQFWTVDVVPMWEWVDPRVERNFGFDVPERMSRDRRLAAQSIPVTYRRAGTRNEMVDWVSCLGGIVRIVRAFSRHAPADSPRVRRLVEEQYRAEHRAALPGSLRTARLRKKRRDAVLCWLERED